LVKPAVVQETLRLVFSRWGRPKRFRVDNGTPWGSAGDWPTDLALWLIGLGVAMTWNPPRTPQDNGVVERSQGTGKRWTEPSTCKDADELQRRMDDMDRIQREVYPSIQGKSRWQAFPDLKQVDRPYSKTWEKRHWDLELVLAHMSEYSAVRHVDRKGRVSVYNRHHCVGAAHQGKSIYVFLDPVDREWVFATAEGVQIRRKVAEEITRARIVNLQVTDRRDGASRASGKTQCRD
jgi:transposase InsO family protein